jgi:hypothetical protein
MNELLLFYLYNNNKIPPPYFLKWNVHFILYNANTIPETAFLYEAESAYVHNKPDKKTELCLL